MDQHEPKHTPRSRLKKQTGYKMALFIMLLACISGGLLWYLKDPSLSLESLLTAKKTQISSEKPGITFKTAQQSPSPQTAKAPPPDVTINQTTVVEAPQDQPKEDRPLEDGCENECARINSFYSHLDTRDYIRTYKLPKPSKEYFSELIVKLANNPPVITRETDDLFTILKNTAHFFRVIGKQNIVIIKGILDQEKDSIETILADFYSASQDKECLKSRMRLEIPDTALYKYAGFFLNTMGGRLYLFRRDSFSRLPISYYSIRVIDQANIEGTNKDGIDIRPAISSLISEIENTGNKLKLKEIYLEELYALKEKYPQETEQ